jgi:hypothetical protein
LESSGFSAFPLCTAAALPALLRKSDGAQHTRPHRTAEKEKAATQRAAAKAGIREERRKS